MQKTKRTRAMFLALSGMCAVGAMLWFFVLFYVSQVIEIVGYLWWKSVFFPNPINPFVYLSVFFFVKGFTPGKHKALKSSLLASGVLLGAYIAMVAFIKWDFVSAMPIRIACGLAPVLAAFWVMLFFDGPKWRKMLCVVLASLALCVSTWTYIWSSHYNTRDIIGYSISPGGTHKIVMVRDLTTKWKICVACPVYGLWYKQKDPVYDLKPDALQSIVWLDENTAQIDNKYGNPQTITFK